MYTSLNYKNMLLNLPVGNSEFTTTFKVFHGFL